MKISPNQKAGKRLATAAAGLTALVVLAGCASSKSKPALLNIEDVPLASFAGPVDPVYRISPGDTVSVTVYRRSDLQPIIDLPSVVVEPYGGISLPLAGDIHAEGLSIPELREELVRRIEGNFNQPVIDVRLVEAIGKKIYVLGEVRNPGIYNIRGGIQAMECLLMAGGFSSDADLKRIVLIRTRPATAPAGESDHQFVALNFRKLLEEADVVQNAPLLAGDILYVPPDYIGRSNRFFQHLDNMISPFANIVGTVASVIVLENTSERD